MVSVVLNFKDLCVGETEMPFSYNPFTKTFDKIIGGYVKTAELITAHGIVSSGIESFDLNNGSYHTVTVGGNFILEFDNWLTTGVMSTVIKLTDAGNHTITWPGAVDWPNGIEPTWTTSGTDFAVFFSDDFGTTIYGGRSLTDMK